jgi:hypothetical protein
VKIKIKTKVLVNAAKTAKQRGLGIGGKAQQFIDSEVLRLCEPNVPKRGSELIRSGIRSTVIGQGQVIYNTPYARRWYYEPADFSEAPKRGNYWFGRMMNEGGRESILKGAAAVCGGKAGK